MGSGGRRNGKWNLKIGREKEVVLRGGRKKRTRGGRRTLVRHLRIRGLHGKHVDEDGAQLSFSIQIFSDLIQISSSISSHLIICPPYGYFLGLVFLLYLFVFRNWVTHQLRDIFSLNIENNTYYKNIN